MCSPRRDASGPARRGPDAARSLPPDLRVSDADRDRTVEELRRHAADGRLAVDELEERIERAHAARLGRELTALTADLPAGAPPTRRGSGHGEVRTYLAVMALLVAIWALTGAGYFWPVWPMLGWGLAVLPHAGLSKRRAQPPLGGRAAG